MQISHHCTCFPSLPCPTPSLQVITPDGAPCATHNFSPAIHLTPNSVYMLMLLFPFIPLSLSHTMSTNPFSTSPRQNLNKKSEI